jgi:hypothetical protein
MKRFHLLLCMALIGTGAAFGHGQATERYVPVGQSPDSGVRTLYGVVESIEAQSLSIHLRVGATLHVVAVRPDTSLWLDRSKLQLTTQTLRFDDLRTNELAEVRCADGACDGPVVADWIKIEASSP